MPTVHCLGIAERYGVVVAQDAYGAGALAWNSHLHFLFSLFGTSLGFAPRNQCSSVGCCTAEACLLIWTGLLVQWGG